VRYDHGVIDAPARAKLLCHLCCVEHVGSLPTLPPGGAGVDLLGVAPSRAALRLGTRSGCLRCLLAVHAGLLRRILCSVGLVHGAG
jgi:hypothetical protein